MARSQLTAARRSTLPSSNLRPRPAVILFDLDGTLVDTMQVFADIAATVIARRYGVPWRNARHLYLQTSGVPFAQQLEVMFGDHPENEAASAEFERLKHDVAKAAALPASTQVALEQLRAMGIRLVVSSNGMQEHVDAFAARTPGLFDLSLGFRPGFGKGEPHVAAVCDRLNVGRDDLAFVGDSLRDGELASTSGVRFVGKAGTFSHEEFARTFPDIPVIDEVSQLSALV